MGARIPRYNSDFQFDSTELYSSYKFSILFDSRTESSVNERFVVDAIRRLLPKEQAVVPMCVRDRLASSREAQDRLDFIPQF